MTNTLHGLELIAKNDNVEPKDSVQEARRDMRKLQMAIRTHGPNMDMADFEKRYAKELKVLEAIEKMMEEDKAQSAIESNELPSETAAEPE